MMVMTITTMIIAVMLAGTEMMTAMTKVFVVMMWMLMMEMSSLIMSLF